MQSLANYELEKFDEIYSDAKGTCQNGPFLRFILPPPWVHHSGQFNFWPLIFTHKKYVFFFSDKNNDPKIFINRLGLQNY